MLKGVRNTTALGVYRANLSVQASGNGDSHINGTAESGVEVDIIGLRNVTAITQFKVIRGHRFWYQSKAHMRLPISD